MYHKDCGTSSHGYYRPRQARAMAIFVTFADYLGNYTESDNNHGHLIYESDAIDFEGLVLEMLDEDQHVSVREILK